MLSRLSCINCVSHVFQYLQAEHTSLRSDLKELVTENRHLSDKLKNVVSTKFKIESNVSPRHKKESNMLTNLQQQLSVVAQVSCLLELAELYDCMICIGGGGHIWVIQKR